MSDTDGKWKTGLLASGVPLEYEASLLLTSAGFSVSADYAYSREDAGVAKDFSVDIEARATYPFSDPNRIQAALSLLVECKYRHPRVIWLFLPDPNQPDLSPITLGSTLHSIDEFSWTVLSANATVPFDEHIPFALKGVEVNLSNGNAFDADIHQGISQLQYALPRLFSDLVSFNLNGHPRDNVPFFYCPILLTSAPVYIANPTISVADVMAADDIATLGDPHPYIVLYRDYSPDFEQHCVWHFSSLREMLQKAQLKRIHHARNADPKLLDAPLETIKGLLAGQRYFLHSLFSQFIICTLTAFPDLLAKISSTVDHAMRSSAPLQRPKTPAT
jgi:hypothetical protein